ncbi:S24 family peptidase [Klebsiella sp. Ap-873]|nr:S24 family peptidase [Klebsiella sp. Ap-873]
MNNRITKLNDLPENFRPYAAFGRCDTSNLFLVQMPDDGMEGTLRCGELLLVEPYNQDAAYWWDGIYYYELRGSLYVRRLQRVADGILIRADNKKLSDFEMNEDRLFQLNFKILGIVRFHVARLC